MKVFEIITETQQLNEAGEGLLVKLLGLVGINLVERAAAKAAMEKIIAKYAADIAAATKAGTRYVAPDEAALQALLKAEGLSDDVIAKLMKNPGKLLSTVEKEAIAMARKAALQAGTAEVRLAAKEAIKMFGTSWNWAYGLANAYGYGQPLVACVTSVMDIYKKHEAGDPEYKDPQDAKDAIQYHIDKCVQQMAGLFAGTKILKGGFGMIKNYPWKSGEMMSKVWDGASAAGRMAFVAWMDTDEGRKTYAEWLLGETWAAQGFKKLADWLSGAATLAANKMVRVLHPSDLNAPNPGQPIKPSSGPSSTQRDPFSGRALNERLARRLR